RKGRLFIKNDAQVECNNENNSVDAEYRRARDQAPARNRAENSYIHGIANDAIKPDDHELLRWVPRRQGSFTDCVEVSYAPQENRYAKQQQRPTEQRSPHSPTIAA